MRAAAMLEATGWMALLLMIVLASPGVRIEASPGGPPAVATHAAP